mmetsp:Transcript_19650/g.47608  ORF Transcript_19650/g.47608 Transcript_19650/m.47608 type:complete len:485 (-) Transcript_19650:179-1633(-)
MFKQQPHELFDIQRPTSVAIRLRQDTTDSKRVMHHPQILKQRDEFVRLDGARPIRISQRKIISDHLDLQAGNSGTSFDPLVLHGLHKELELQLRHFTDIKMVSIRPSEPHPHKFQETLQINLPSLFAMAKSPKAQHCELLGSLHGSHLHLVQRSDRGANAEKPSASKLLKNLGHLRKLPPVEANNAQKRRQSGLPLQAHQLHELLKRDMQTIRHLRCQLLHLDPVVSLLQLKKQEPEIPCGQGVMLVLVCTSKILPQAIVQHPLNKRDKGAQTPTLRKLALESLPMRCETVPTGAGWRQKINFLQQLKSAGEGDAIISIHILQFESLAEQGFLCRLHVTNSNVRRSQQLSAGADRGFAGLCPLLPHPLRVLMPRIQNGRPPSVRKRGIRHRNFDRRATIGGGHGFFLATSREHRFKPVGLHASATVAGFLTQLLARLLQGQHRKTGHATSRRRCDQDLASPAIGRPTAIVSRALGLRGRPVHYF